MQKSIAVQRITKVFEFFLYVILGVTLAFLISTTASAQSAFNKELNYQGKLLTSSGNAVGDGTYSIEFNLYTVANGGTSIWTETNNVTTVNGLFSVLLGDNTALTSVDFNDELWLGINVEGDGEMSPRKKLGAVAAAFEADRLDGLDSTRFAQVSEDGNQLFMNGARIGNLQTTISFGPFAGVQGNLGTFFGWGAGSNSTGWYNTAVGYQAGMSNSTGASNVFIGESTGQESSGSRGVYVGQLAGYESSGDDNMFVGYLSGWKNTTGAANTFLGTQAGTTNTTGSNNYFAGYQSGYSNITGSGNIFLGYQAGYNETGSNKLYIENSNSTTPLIYGEFDNDLLRINGVGEIAYSDATTNSVASLFTLDRQSSGTVASGIGAALNFDIEDSGGSENQASLGVRLTTTTDGSEESEAYLSLNDAGTITEVLALSTELDEIIIGSGAASANTANDIIAIGRNALGTHAYEDNDGIIAIGTNAGSSIDQSSNEGVGSSVLIGYEAGRDALNPNGLTYIGYQAGRSTNNFWAVDNTFVGQAAGYGNTSGFDNTFVGTGAGYAIGAGDFNSFFGYSTGSNSVGTSVFGGNTNGNTFIGHNSGDVNATGSYNIALGASAYTGVSTTSTGSYGIYIGAGTGQSQTSGDDNIYIGRDSGFSSVSGALNVFLGSYSGYYSTASNNTFLGYRAGYGQSGLSTGASNVFVGYESGYSNTTGTDNTFVGYQTGRANTTASNNTFFGDLAGSSTTTGGVNVFIGGDAGLANTTGFENTFLGHDAGTANTTGDSNTALGRSALLANTTGSDNVAVGHSAGAAISTADHNVLVGTAAGAALTTGANNIIIGGLTASAATTAASNAIIGRGAAGALTEGTNNVIFGFNAGDTLTTGDYNILIGDSTEPTSATASNELNIGNTIYGDLSTDSVGIGIASPGSPLHVYENNVDETGVGLTLEQDGTGDTYVRYLLTGEAEWSVGVDNSYSNAYRWSTNAGASADPLANDSFMTLTATGELSIGEDTLPAATLHVDGNTKSTVPLLATERGSLGSPSTDYQIQLRSNTGGTYTNGTWIYHAENAEDRDILTLESTAGVTATFESGGKIGFGDTDPDNGGLVVADGVVIGADSTDNLIDDASNGAASTTLYIGNETIDTTVSDERLKQNIRPSQDGALSFLQQFNVKSFEWLPENPRSELGPIQYGLIAQEVQTFAPQYIKQGSNPDDIMSIRFAELTGVTIKAIQELNLQIDELQNQPIATSAGTLNESSLLNLLNTTSEKVIGGVVRIKDLFVDIVTARRVVTNEIELRDKATGSVYCVAIENGVLGQTLGGCTDEAEVETPAPALVVEPEVVEEEQPEPDQTEEEEMVPTDETEDESDGVAVPTDTDEGEGSQEEPLGNSEGDEDEAPAATDAADVGTETTENDTFDTEEEPITELPAE
jgi:hypothetical protein